jgi:uncharacterized RDD family membrane protein YckC
MIYHIARNGQQLGTFSDQDIRFKLQSNELSSGDMYWTEGMTDWQTLGSTSQFGAGVVNPYAPPRAELADFRQGRKVVELASLGQRLGAALLDSLVAVVCAVPIIIGADLSESSSGDPSGDTVLIAIGAIALLALMIYNIVLLVTRGQTLGKKWLDIRIADYQTNENAGAVKALLLRGFVNGLFGLVPLLGSIYPIVDICFIFREDRRCIHDLLAGTHVVQGSLS